MALVSRWDIRTESYSDGATVASLTDRAGTTPLNSAMGVTKPTYDLALNAVKFVAASQHCLGNSSLSTSLSSAPAGSSWSIFFLIYQTTLASDFLGGFGNSAQVNSGLCARTFAAGTNPQFFLRDNTDSTAQSVSATAQLTSNTWQVLHATYDGANVRVGIDGTNLSSNTLLTEVLSGVTWNQFALGAYARSTTGSHWTGFLRECRVYNTNEFSNLSTIVSDMKAGPTSITTVGNNNTIYANSSNVVVTGLVLDTGTSAKLVYANQQIAMLNYTANATQPYFTSPSLANVFASRIQFTDSANLQILNAASGIIASKTVAFLPSPLQKLVHNVTDVSSNTNIGSLYYGQNPAVSVSDQIIYDAKSSLNCNVTVDSQGFFALDSSNTANNNDSFAYRIYESSLQYWGNEGTITTLVPINARSASARVVKSDDGKRYSKFPSGGSYIAANSYNFNQYSDGTSLSNYNPFDAAGRTKANTTTKYGATGASALMSIRTGDLGGYGNWGGIINLPRNYVKNEEIWVRWRQYWPSAFSFTATPAMKFLRLKMLQSSANNSNAGYMDLYINDEVEWGSWVYGSIREFDNNNNWAYTNNTTIPRDQWITYEVYCKLDVNASMGGSGVLWRFWIDGQLVQERDATSTGTMNEVTNVLTSVWWFTYWNNENPPNNDTYVDDIIIATSDSPPYRYDSGNRVFIGT